MEVALVGAGFARKEAIGVARALHRRGADRLAIVDRVIRVAVSGESYRFSFGRANEVILDSGKAIALCYTLASSKDVAIRRRVTNNVGLIQTENRIPLLGRLLRDPDVGIQQCAFKYLDEVSPQVTKALAGVGVIKVEPRQGVGYYVSTSVPKVTRHPEVPIGIRQVNAEAGGDDWTARPPQGGGGGGGSATPPTGAPPPPPRPSPPDTLRRFTDVRFVPIAGTPSAGHLTFTLRVKAPSPTSPALDIRVPPGRDQTALLIVATSREFAISESVQVINVLRVSDSDSAKFHVRASKPGAGEVALLVYDEYRLIGSAVVQFQASETAEGLALAMSDYEVFREAGTAQCAIPRGFTLQVSFDTQDGLRVVYHALTAPSGEGAAPDLHPMGRASVRYEAGTIPDALTALRAQVDTVEKGLDSPVETLGAADEAEALADLNMILRGAGRQLGDDLLSPEVRGYLWALPRGSAVNLVISDRALDAVPWELARDPITKEAVNEHVVLVRVPVRAPLLGTGPLPISTAPIPIGSTPRRLVYVLGDGVYKGANFEPVNRPIAKAPKGLAIETNFATGTRVPVSAVKLKAMTATADIVHLLCHGIVEDGRNLYLAIEKRPAGRISPEKVRDFDMPQRPLVFVNACSSAAGTMSLTGLTTFGWSFLRAGAGAFIGALAPVTTDLAMRFSEAFFEVYFQNPGSVAEAVFAARQRVSGGLDPTWILYTLYADLSDAAA